MSRDDIIRMATLCDLGRTVGPLDTLLDHEWEDLHRFAALVAAHEREECAEACLSIAQEYIDTTIVKGVAECCAAAIRARGNA